MRDDPVTYAAPLIELPECRDYREIRKTTLKAILELDDDELERRFDELMTGTRPSHCPPVHGLQLGPNDYRDELNRRAADRETRSIKQLTIIATVAAVLAALPIIRDAVQWLMALIE